MAKFSFGAMRDTNSRRFKRSGYCALRVEYSLRIKIFHPDRLKAPLPTYKATKGFHTFGFRQLTQSLFIDFFIYKIANSR
jgi:hypothetical protein